MKKKIIGILVMTLLIATAMTIPALNIDETTPLLKNSLSTLDDELDQQQTNPDFALCQDLCIIYAQSFKPTLNILTRIQLLAHSLSDMVSGWAWIQIRSDLSGSNFTECFVDMAYKEEGWIEFDIHDIFVYPERTYYIVVGNCVYPRVCWCADSTDNYTRGDFFAYDNDRRRWRTSSTYKDLCFKTYGYNDSDVYPDLDCYGKLSWTGVNQSSFVYGQFTVKNVGTSNSILDWEIVEYPDWGNYWTFTPPYGYGLIRNESTLVQVQVLAPDSKNQIFNGEIKIANMGNSSDNCTISVSLATPKTKAINTPFLKFLENHPHMFPILRKIFD